MPAGYILLGETNRLGRVGRRRGNDRSHPRPGLGSTLDLQAATQLGCSLAHRVQTEMPRLFALGIEADAVVPDLQPDLGVVLAQNNPNLRGACVAAGIVQRLLGNA